MTHGNTACLPEPGPAKAAYRPAEDIVADILAGKIVIPRAAQPDLRDAEIARLRVALSEIEKLSPRTGGVGQIARDALRICR